MTDTSAAGPAARPAPDERSKRPFALVVLAGIMALKGVLIFVVVIGSMVTGGARVPRILRIQSIASAGAATPGALGGLLLVGGPLLGFPPGLPCFPPSGRPVGVGP